MLQALDFFAIPEHLWPTGLQLLGRQQQHLQRWIEASAAVAEHFVKQICALALGDMIDPSKPPSAVCHKDLQYHATFYISHISSGLYVLVRDRPARWRPLGSDSRNPVPSPVQQAVIIAMAKIEHLDVEFNGSSAYWQVEVRAAMT